MTKNCGRHDKPIPMFPAVIDFHLQKLFIGYYCIYCHNFIPKAPLECAELLPPHHALSGGSAAGGAVAHCVVWERKPKTAVVWYRDDEAEGVEEFVDPAEAEQWAENC